jgi:hypothetical protein
MLTRQRLGLLISLLGLAGALIVLDASFIVVLLILLATAVGEFLMWRTRRRVKDQR